VALRRQAGIFYKGWKSKLGLYFIAENGKTTVGEKIL
jgi:hypothetical protein